MRLIAGLLMVAAGFAGYAGIARPAAAQSEQPMVSTCQAIAEAVPDARYATYMPGRLPLVFTGGIAQNEVRITFATHSTYLIETASGISIATDYAGYAGAGIVPTAVTMNQAHSTHFTNYPDPAIEHVFRGWNPEGGPAKHYEMVGDVLVRNVPTDIDRFGMYIKDGNSIFIFEAAGLCIGHLGHLHHMLTDVHFAEIGRLDVVMVPVDGGLTLSHTGMSEIVKRLRASIVLPMHRFGGLQSFIAMLGDTVEVEVRQERHITVSLNSLPRRPTLMVLQGHF